MKKEQFGQAYKPSKEEVSEVRAAVDKLVAEGKVYRDSEGRVWPVDPKQGRA